MIMGTMATITITALLSFPVVTSSLTSSSRADQGLMETISGRLNDPVFGPFVVFGLGGVQAERSAIPLAALLPSIRKPPAR